MPDISEPCAFRYIVRGRTFCALAIVESRHTLAEVIPSTCAECPIPGLIAAHPCGRMDLGVQISVHAGRAVVEMHYASCEVTVERLLEFDHCGEGRCPYWEPYNPERAREIVAAARARQIEREAQHRG